MDVFVYSDVFALKRYVNQICRLCFQAQIKTEVCNAGLCLCGYTVRNGGSIFTWDKCGGTYRVGNLLGEDNLVYMSSDMSSSGVGGVS